MGNGICGGATSFNAFEPAPLEVTELYQACEAGNIEQVKRILTSTTHYAPINCLEPNGSTALHVASSCGHADIVRLLVQDYGVVCHRKNLDGLTAYQVAANDTIREIFHRPKNSARFSPTIESVALNVFAIFFPASKRPPPPWVNTTTGTHRINLMEGRKKKEKLIKNNLAFNVFTNLQRASLPDPFVASHEAKALKSYVERFVGSSNTEYNKACQCLDEFKRTKKVEPLLRLYSLETPFYSKVVNPLYCHALLNPLERNLSALSERHFQGTSYRGLSMVTEDLEEYKEALRLSEEEEESVIALAGFASTTLDKQLAQSFAAARTTDDKIMVLMTLFFPERCDTAIILYAASESAPCISNFENEEEVLVLPGSIFSVTKVDETTDAPLTHIHLTNVVPKIHVGTEILQAINKRTLDL